MKRLLLLAILLAPLAMAHAVPYGSTPTAGARLDDAPLEVVVHFTEPVYQDGTWIRVFDAEEQRVDDDNLAIQFGNQPTLTIGTSSIGHGAYRIQWQTYSQTDGHTVGGSIGFAVGSFASPETETIGEDAIRPFGVIARTLQYVGYAAGAATLLAIILAWPGPTKQVATGSALLQVAAHALLFLDTSNATGLGLSYATTPGGTDLLIRTTAWAIWPLLWRLPRVWIGAWLLLALSDARFGHGSQSGAWAVAIEWIHLVAISVWIGGLVWFVSMGAPRKEGQMFGRIALWSVILIGFTGFALTVGVLQEQTLAAGRTASFLWGKLLYAKIALAGAMVVLATINRYGILGNEGEPLGWLRARSKNWSLRKVAGTEAAIGFVTLLIAGALLSSGAPASLAQVQPVFQEDVEGFRLSGTMQISPLPKAGQEHQFRVYLLEDEPVRNNTCGREHCNTVEWYRNELGPLTAETADLVPEGDGWWTFENLLFLQPGNHTVTVHANTAWSQESLAVQVNVA